MPMQPNMQIPLPRWSFDCQKTHTFCTQAYQTVLACHETPQFSSQLPIKTSHQTNDLLIYHVYIFYFLLLLFLMTVYRHVYQRS